MYKSSFDRELIFLLFVLKYNNKKAQKSQKPCFYYYLIKIN